MSETKITMPRIMLALGKLPGVRLFRNNVGMAWQGQAAKKGNVVIIANPRPLHAGLCEGSSDLIGWQSITITPDMVGQRVAIFTAIEVKGERGTTSPEQLNFIARIKEAGGIAGIARNEQEALSLLKR